MYRKLFIKEFMGTGRRLISLATVLVVTFILLAISITSIETEMSSNDISDVELAGKNNSQILQYEMYTDILPIYEFFIEKDETKELDVHPVITRALISLQSSTLKKLTVYVQGFKEDYMNKELEKDLVEGRLPQNDNEVVVGSYFKEYFQISVGDEIGSKPIPLQNGQGEILFNITLKSLDENMDPEKFIKQFKDYKVVGVISNDDLNFSIVRMYEDTISPNKVLVYFNGKKAEKKYEEISEAASKAGLNSLIGSVKDNYVLKKNSARNLSVSIAMTSMIFLSILLLVLLYILKGTNRKIGIMKSLGIQDSVILKVFANGFILLLLCTLVISIGLTNVIYYFLNKDINNYFGFAMDRYKYSWIIFAAQVLFSVISYIMIVLTIKIKTSRISPKECITKI